MEGLKLRLGDILLVRYLYIFNKRANVNKAWFVIRKPLFVLDSRHSAFSIVDFVVLKVKCNEIGPGLILTQNK